MDEDSQKTQISEGGHAAPLALQAQSSDHAGKNNDDSSVFNDVDREWVDKTRLIVEQTLGDPYLQSQELSKLRIHYLRSRFERHVKSPEDGS